MSGKVRETLAERPKSRLPGEKVETEKRKREKLRFVRSTKDPKRIKEKNGLGTGKVGLNFEKKPKPEELGKVEDPLSLRWGAE